MGLTVYYRYKIKADVNSARRLIKRLRAFAGTLQFDSISDIVEYDPPDGRQVFKRPAPGGRAFKPGTVFRERRRGNGQTETVHIDSLHSLCFWARVNGAESAAFGLASHPPVVIHHEDIITKTSSGEQRQIGAGSPIEFPTRLRGWYSWSQCCKTQYAAHPRHGGIENFLRAHLILFQMIDQCRRMGMTTRIRDDASFWKHHDHHKLIAELHRWDELVAGVVGPLSDALSDKGAIVAPIKERPDFEHLEARGATHLRKIRHRERRRP